MFFLAFKKTFNLIPFHSLPKGLLCHPGREFPVQVVMVASCCPSPKSVGENEMPSRSFLQVPPPPVLQKVGSKMSQKALNVEPFGACCLTLAGPTDNHWVTWCPSCNPRLYPWKGPLLSENNSGSAPPSKWGPLSDVNTDSRVFFPKDTQGFKTGLRFPPT